MTSEEFEDPEDPSVVAPSPRTAARRRRRRIILLVLAVLGLVVWAFLPMLASALITRAAQGATGGVCTIQNVDVHLLRGEVVLEGFSLTDQDPAKSSTSLTVDSAEVEWSWRDLIFGDGGVDVTIVGLDFTVDLQAPWTGRFERTREGPPLGKVRSLVLHDGRIAATLADTPTPVLEFIELEVTLNATAFGASTADSMTSRATLVGVDQGGGRLELDASFAPLAPLSAWSLEAKAEEIDLRPLNPIARRLFEMDVDRGALSLHARVTQTRGHRRGQIEHSFHDLRLLTPGEVVVRHPMAEALFSSMLSSSDQPIVIDKVLDERADQAQGPALDLSVGLDDAAFGDALERITGIIHRGYERRLNTLDGYDVTIGGLQVDYPRNRLRFSDLEVRKTNLPDAAPFFTLDALIVDVEQSIIHREVDTYKAVTLVGPHLTFIAGKTPETSQLNFDPEWVDKISAMPYPTDSLVIKDGRVEYRDLAGATAAFLGLTDLQVEGRSLARGVDPSATKPLTVELQAQIVAGGRLAATLRLRPGVTPPEGHFELLLTPTPLAPLNPISRHYAQIDSSSGSVGVDLEVDLRDGVARGVILAKFDEVELLGENEQYDRPLLEFMIDKRLRTLDGKPIEVDVPAATLTEFRDALPRTLVRAVLDASKSEPLIGRP